jgi:RNA polymerase sigma factor (sigma-70 family)
MYTHPLIQTELARQRRLELQRAGSRSKRASDSAPANQVTRLVSAARSGDERAWEALVARFTPTIRAVARSYRLNTADVEDIVQTTWAKAFAHLSRIRQPEALGGWLRVTAGREALRTAQHRRREIVDDEPEQADLTDNTTPEDALLAAEQHEFVHAAIEQLPDRQRTLLTALDGACSYADVARNLDIPLGAIGPTRARALARLRANHRLAALHTTT